MAIKDLLVAYQGDEGSQKALTFALQMADKYQAGVSGAHVHAPQRYESDVRRWIGDDVFKTMRQAEAEGLTLTKSDGTPYKFFEPVLIDPKEPLGDALDGQPRVAVVTQRPKGRMEDLLARVRGVVEGLVAAWHSHPCRRLPDRDGPSHRRRP
jgi:hypothetical protein